MITVIVRMFALAVLAITLVPKHVGGEATTDAWQKRDVVNAGPSRRYLHTAVWTGSEMIIWGGEDDSYRLLNTGGRYSPATDSWTAVSLAGVPTKRRYHTAVWTGSEMIVWGGDADSNTGGRYNPATDTWVPVTTVGAPDAREDHTAVWTGTEMIVWGGRGTGSRRFKDGARYNPATDSWTLVSPSDAPAAREAHTAVWTGTGMIVWGGYVGGVYLTEGGQYDPQLDSWTLVSPSDAPAARAWHIAVWTGSEMIVWGGNYNGIMSIAGGRYNPATDTWKYVSPTDPAGLVEHTAVWTGSEMVVWGGRNISFKPNTLNSGARYSPTTDTWRALTLIGAPGPRGNHSTVWTGSEMIVWGGDSYIPLDVYGDTFSYAPGSDDFRISSVVRQGGNLTLSFPSVIGSTYTLWRSDTLAAGTWIDTGLPVLVGTGATLAFTVPATTAATRFFRVQVGP